MPEDIRSLVKEHHALYEVSPCYVVFDDSHGKVPETTRRIQAGFDIDVYGIKTQNDGGWMPPPDKYGLCFAELKRIAENVSRDATDFCSLEVIPFPSTTVFDVQNHDNLEARVQIRISHCGDLDQPAGQPEQHALEQVERQLQSLGIHRR